MDSDRTPTPASSLSDEQIKALVETIKAAVREKPTAVNGYGLSVWAKIESDIIEALVRSEPQPEALTGETVLRSDFDKLLADLTGAKNLLVRLYAKHPDARAQIEGSTGNWFVLGTDRDSSGVDTPLSGEPIDVQAFVEWAEREGLDTSFTFAADRVFDAHITEAAYKAAMTFRTPGPAVGAAAGASSKEATVQLLMRIHQRANDPTSLINDATLEEALRSALSGASPTEAWQAAYEQGRRDERKGWVGADDQGPAEIAGADAIGVGATSRDGADEYHQHRAWQSSPDGPILEIHRRGAGVQSRDQVRSVREGCRYFLPAGMTRCPRCDCSAALSGASPEPTFLGGLSIDDINPPPHLHALVVAAWNHNLPDLKSALERPEPVEALRAALELSKYAAAPFFGDKLRHRDEAGDEFYTYRTTQEWWDGLQELIERVQPKLSAALAQQPAQPLVDPVVADPSNTSVHSVERSGPLSDAVNDGSGRRYELGAICPRHNITHCVACWKGST